MIPPKPVTHPHRHLALLAALILAVKLHGQPELSPCGCPCRVPTDEALLPFPSTELPPLPVLPALGWAPLPGLKSALPSDCVHSTANCNVQCGGNKQTNKQKKPPKLIYHAIILKGISGSQAPSSTYHPIRVVQSSELSKSNMHFPMLMDLYFSLSQTTCDLNKHPHTHFRIYHPLTTAGAST